MSSKVPRRGVCLIVAAPAGAGKSSVLREVVGLDGAIGLSVSATTRAPRPNERHGVDYVFTDQAGFDGMVQRGEMLEWATVFGRSYGSPKAPVADALAAGRDVAFDIDWQGHRQVRAALPDDVVSVFLLPPSMKELRGRLVRRAGDSEAEIERRMAAARHEIAHWQEFDHVLVNARFEETVQAVHAILMAARTRRLRQTGMESFVQSLTAPEPGAPL